MEKEIVGLYSCVTCRQRGEQRVKTGRTVRIPAQVLRRARFTPGLFQTLSSEFPRFAELSLGIFHECRRRNVNLLSLPLLKNHFLVGSSSSQDVARFTFVPFTGPVRPAVGRLGISRTVGSSEKRTREKS